MWSGKTRSLQQLGDDLGIRLSIEADLLQTPGMSHLFPDRCNDCSSAGAGGEENSAVNVEEDQLAFQRSSSLRTATSLGRSVPPRVPGNHGSLSTPPQASVEWISVSASPAKAT